VCPVVFAFPTHPQHPDLGIYPPVCPEPALSCGTQAQAIVFGGAGILLTLAPEAAVGIWPWTLTPLLSRVYGSFFLAFAVGALLAAHERRRAALRPFLVGSLALLVCTLAASLAHLDRFHEGPSRLLWFAAHVIGVAIFAIAMATLSRGARPRGSPVVAEP